MSLFKKYRNVLHLSLMLENFVEQKLKHLDLQQLKCSQFIRYNNIILSSSILYRWVIDFNIVIQSKLSNLIQTSSNEYYWGINISVNKTEAIEANSEVSLIIMNNIQVSNINVKSFQHFVQEKLLDLIYWQYTIACISYYHIMFFKQLSFD